MGKERGKNMFESEDVDARLEHEVLFDCASKWRDFYGFF